MPDVLNIAVMSDDSDTWERQLTVIAPNAEAVYGQFRIELRTCVSNSLQEVGRARTPLLVPSSNCIMKALFAMRVFDKFTRFSPVTARFWWTRLGLAYQRFDSPPSHPTWQVKEMSSRKRLDEKPTTSSGKPIRRTAEWVVLFPLTPGYHCQKSYFQPFGHSMHIPQRIS